MLTWTLIWSLSASSPSSFDAKGLAADNFSALLGGEQHTLNEKAPTAGGTPTITLREFQEAFNRVKQAGYVPTKRRGSTGVGHTLEQLLGLKENNVDLPDLGFAELKAHRVNSPSMITLFTSDRNAWKMNPLDAVRKYGTRDSNGRLGLFVTLARTPNHTGLFLDVGADKISVRHLSGEVIAEWNLDDLARQFNKKLPALVLVSAMSEMRAGLEYFHYHRAQLLVGTSSAILREQILADHLLVDLRLHDQVTRARNHGTGFRTREDKLPLLFKSVQEL